MDQSRSRVSKMNGELSDFVAVLFELILQRLDGFVLFFGDFFDFLEGFLFGGLDLVFRGGLEAFELFTEVGNH